MTRQRPVSRKRLKPAEIFAVPLVIFMVSLAGLIAALLVDGWIDALAALASGSGLVACAWGMRRRG